MIYIGGRDVIYIYLNLLLNETYYVYNIFHSVRDWERESQRKDKRERERERLREREWDVEGDG